MEVVDRKIVVRYCLIVLEWAKMYNLLCVNDFHSTGQKGRDSAGRGGWRYLDALPGGALRDDGTAAAA